MENRYLQTSVRKDLDDKKMVFIAGPRQVGKTTLAKQIQEAMGGGLYFSWDRREDRRKLLEAKWPAESTTIVLDELHKYPKWKRWIKGEYDLHKDKLRVIVTGSARLDVYRKGGDSLQGRYHHYRLHPFSLAVIGGIQPHLPIGKELDIPREGNREVLDQLLRFSGFPEPMLAQSERTRRRWQKERLERFFREDVRDLENVRELAMLELLADLLPGKVGSLLSINALREDLEVSHRAASHWIQILETLYFAFRVYPFAGKKVRSLKKEPKLYLWDWTLVENPSARFENLVASHLLKFCHYLEDVEGYSAELFYLRNVAKKEVDFLVTVDRKPWFAVEVKVSAQDPAKELVYFGQRLSIPYLYQIHLNGDEDYLKNGVRVAPAAKFLYALI